MNLTNPPAPIQEIQLTRIDGTPIPIDAYRNKVLLIVNTASACGFTPQYAALEALYRQYRDHGLVILGFPCNQFGAQEPGDEKAIAEFCESRFGVSFPMFAKADVNGPQTHPLFALLKQRAPGFLGTESIKWNFTKFLVSRDGISVQRFSPWTHPERLHTAIATALGV